MATPSAAGLDGALAQAWVRRWAEQIASSADHLSSLDSAIGDGDHGANLNRGLVAAVAALDPEPGGAGGVLTGVGRALVSHCGGASGPLFGSGLRAAGKSLTAAAQDGAAGPVDVGAALEAMAAAIARLGGAVEGDKTMLDALLPAAAAFVELGGADADLAGCAAAAADAADSGVAATIPMVARKGRASYLGERSAGHADPGATSIALLLRSLAEVTAP